MTEVRRLQNALWVMVALAAGVVHLGTAVLRINSFFPAIQALDFSSYYAAAWSIRLNVSPYTLSPDVLAFLAKTQHLSHTPPICASPPLWAWLLQPLTVLSFPYAAASWLLFLTVMAVCCHVLLLEIAGYKGWRIALATLPLTITFGPLFLNLTLGQNAIVLLLSALILGKALRHGSRGHTILWIPVWIVAVAAKIFPVLWLVCLPFLKRFRIAIVASGFCLAAFLGMALLRPEVNSGYWRHYLAGRAEQYSRGGADADDQSLKAFFDRMAKPSHFYVQGLSVQEKQEVTWVLPWEFSARSIYWVSFFTAALIGLWLLYSWVCSRCRNPEGELFSLILFTLMIFPNMQRYDHVLALPAMAWLWQRGSRSRRLAIAGYVLFALSRLNHLWVTLLPSPLAPISSGFGLFGVLILLAGIAYEILMPFSNQEPEAVHR